MQDVADHFVATQNAEPRAAACVFNAVSTFVHALILSRVLYIDRHGSNQLLASTARTVNSR